MPVSINITGICATETVIANSSRSFSITAFKRPHVKVTSALQAFFRWHPRLVVVKSTQTTRYLTCSAGNVLLPCRCLAGSEEATKDGDLYVQRHDGPCRLPVKVKRRPLFSGWARLKTGLNNEPSWWLSVRDKTSASTHVVQKASESCHDRCALHYGKTNQALPRVLAPCVTRKPFFTVILSNTESTNPHIKYTNHKQKQQKQS